MTRTKLRIYLFGLLKNITKPEGLRVDIQNIPTRVSPAKKPKYVNSTK